MAVPVPMAVRCFGHALVRRVEVQVGVRPERAALRELALLLQEVPVQDLLVSCRRSLVYHYRVYQYT